MKKLLLATVVGMLAVTAPLSAHADGTGYTGTCRIATVNDTTPDGTLGGQRVWNGEVNILVAASTPGSLITDAYCTIRVNSGAESAPVVSAVTGGPVAAAAGQVQFTADITDTVYICTHVGTTSSAVTDDCAALTTTPVCPVQVCGEGGLLDQVLAALDPVFAAITELTKIPDATLCPVLQTLAPTVDGLPTSGLLYIDPASGDTYVGGTAPEDLSWDCPPYVVA